LREWEDELIAEQVAALAAVRAFTRKRPSGEPFLRRLAGEEIEELAAWVSGRQSSWAPPSYRGNSITTALLSNRSEEIVRIAIEHHLADDLERHDLLADELGRIQHVEIEIIRGFLIECLYSELEFRKIAFDDRIVQIAAVKIGIGAILDCGEDRSFVDGSRL
jgi:hypothetical protein